MDGKKLNSGRKYGLQLKIGAPVVKKPPLKKPVAFSFDDSSAQDEYSVEDDIARQASKKQYAREVELQHKEALEQDANAFDYDNVYDEMKGKQAQPIREDRAKREPKYIGKLLEAAKLRAVEHDIAFERNLAKERAKEDHLFPDKEKFVTKAYKQKLIEQGKWLEEERLKEIKEQADEVTKKADLGDFYRNLLSRNVAYGATKEIEAKKSAPREEGDKLSKEISSAQVIERTGSDLASPSDRTPRDQQTGREEQSKSRDGIRQIDSDLRRSQVVKSSDSDLEESEERSRKDNTGRLDGVEGSPMQKEVQPSTIPAVSRKSKEEAVQAARERYLARKKQKVS
ncbi:hypothetical protein R1sor_025073 [Riccia sorocarpa]|uniref:Nuclear speckle splicing regulatory protein 1 N-terminal domain-containing protein n=1 Tax=Riccia sorocarpa TaxID=122646 RepID=A0ABD3GAM3_9MARC